MSNTSANRSETSLRSEEAEIRHAEALDKPSHRSGQWGENLNAEAQRRGGENAQRETLENAGEQRFEWVLGENERHCPSCAALAGQVHTMKGWAQAGLKPGSARLFCKQCHCRLEPTGREESGDVGIGQLRKVKNREGLLRSPAGYAGQLAGKMRRLFSLCRIGAGNDARP